MLKKMRWHFIMAAMTATAVVMAVIVAVINVWNYSAVMARQDGMLRQIWNAEQGRQDAFSGPEPFFCLRPPRNRGMEMEDMTHFFLAEIDEEGQVVRIVLDNIVSLSREQAAEYATAVLEEGGDRGYYENYRYQVFPADTGKAAVFLNAYRDQQFMQTLLWISCLTAVFSLLVIFCLVVMFSGQAIRPYLKNAERQKQFITDAGHELKTPLTSISTSLDILELEYGEDEWTRNIRRQIGRMTKLTSNLVTLSRLDEEVPIPDKQRFSLSDAVWEAAEPLAALFEARGKSYSQQIEEGMELVGDRALIQQMISILLDNALRYSDEGGEIRLAAYRKHRKQYLEVFNTCGQVEQKELNRLFDRFYRPDSSRSSTQGGSGIGLSIAQAVVQSHGGSISVSSADGKSIRFTVVF